MATSAITVSTLRDNSIDRNTVDYYFKFAIGAGDYTTGGLTVSFSGLVQAPGNPLEVRAFSYSAPNSLYTYSYAPGANQNAGKLMVWQAGVELAAAPTPAGVVADTINAIAKFSR